MSRPGSVQTLEEGFQTHFKKAPAVSEGLVAHYGSAVTDYARASQNPEIGFEPLSLAGLMGPVSIIPAKRVTIAAEDRS